MKDRKLIFVSCLGLFLIVLLCGLLLIVLSNFNRSNNIPVSYPQGPDNIVELNPQDESDFDFAVITTQDTLELRNQLNETSIINLEKKNWKDISWSPDNKTIAILGETDEEAYNILIYRLETKKWTQQTYYSKESGGVSSFAWITPSNIYFIQGLKGDTWLHTLNIDAQANGIVKINQQIGEIVRVSHDGNTLAIKDGNNFKILNVLGKTLNSINLITFSNSTSEEVTETITDLFFPDNSMQVIYSTANGNNVIAKVDEESGVELSNLKNTTICSRGDNLTGYTIDNTTLNLIEGDISNKVEMEYKANLGKEFGVNQSKSICYNSNNFLISINILDNQRWYYLLDGKLEIANFTNNIFEINAKN